MEGPLQGSMDISIRRKQERKGLWQSQQHSSVTMKHQKGAHHHSLKQWTPPVSIDAQTKQWPLRMHPSFPTALCLLW